MQENIFIPLIAMAGGLIALVLGLAKGSRAKAAAAVPCRHISELAPGERQFFSGKARALAPLRAPVSGQPCAFYLETIDQLRRTSRGGSYRERVADNYYGVFWVDDPTGSALVLPAYESLDLAKPPATAEDLSGEIRTERVILDGETVSAMGTPRSLQDLVNYLRQTPRANVSPEALAGLLEAAKAPSGASVPCFFGQGLEAAADRAYADYVAGGSGSASLLVKTGAALLVAGAAMLAYMLNLFGGAPTPD